MSAIKFRKRLTKFKITIALPKKFGSKGFITVVKVIKIWRSSGESYKLRYVYPMWGTPGDITIQKREIDYIKIKIVPFIINFGGNENSFVTMPIKIRFGRCLWSKQSLTFYRSPLQIVKLLTSTLRMRNLAWCCTIDLFSSLLIAGRSRICRKKVWEKSRECHNYIPQPFPDTKRKKKPTNPYKHESNKRTRNIKISSLYPKRGNRNAKRIEKHKNKMTHDCEPSNQLHRFSLPKG